MTDNNKPGDHGNDGVQHRPNKVSEKLSKGSPEVNSGNLRAALKANPNRSDTLSPDGKSRFSLTDEAKPTEKQALAAQEKSYRDAGLGDPLKQIGKPGEPNPEVVQKKPETVLEKSGPLNVERTKETAAQIFQSIQKVGSSKISKTVILPPKGEVHEHQKLDVILSQRLENVHQPKLDAPQHKPETAPEKSVQVNAERAKEAAAKIFQSVYNSGLGALNESGKFIQGMHDGMHDYVNETGQSLAVARDYYGQALTSKVILGADIKEFSGAIGKTLGTASDYYLNQVPTGQANLGNDIGQVTKAAADHWNSLDSEHKGHFIGKEIVPLAVPGAVGMVAKEMQSANFMGKTGEAIAALTSTEKVAEMEKKISPLQGHVQKFSEVLGKPIQPAYATVSDGPGRVLEEVQRPHGLGEGDNLLAMSKSEDLEGAAQMRGKAGAGGDWPKFNERPSPNVVQQTEKYSCVSACGEMISNGKFKQAELIMKLKAPCDTCELADALGPPWKGKGLAPDKLDILLERGPWVAELREVQPPGRYVRLEPGHTVVVDGLDELENIKIRDPADGTSYEMTRENFQKHWSGYSVWK